LYAKSDWSGHEAKEREGEVKRKACLPQADRAAFAKRNSLYFSKTFFLRPFNPQPF
jgi:hypothetical protein